MIRRVDLLGDVALVGDATGRSILYFYIDEQRRQLVHSTDYHEIVAEYLAGGGRLNIDHLSISFLLHHSYIPIGRSVVDGIKSLGVGDFLSVNSEGGVIVSERFPYFNNLSLQTSRPSPRLLLDHLCGAVKRAFVPEKENVLMLSSGKDSVSLALAYAEADMRVSCITFDNDGGGESQYARNVSSKLGLEHETCGVPKDRKTIKERLVAYFAATPVPCVDHVQLAYVLSLAIRYGSSGPVVVDGMGNDIYFGHIAPSALHAKKQFIVQPGLQRFRCFFSFNSMLEKLMLTRSELQFPAPLLRVFDTREFYDCAVDTHGLLRRFDTTVKHLDVIDFRSYVRGKQIDTGPAMQKGRNAAAFVRGEVVFPWADPELAEYCFNLPESSRFNRRELKNKILVRQMLREFIGYDERSLPKRGFEFDGVGFIEFNREYIREEILECKLWNSRVEFSLDRLLDLMHRTPKANYPVLMLFMISGWYNHYYSAHAK